jgi:hypothetical protein
MATGYWIARVDADTQSLTISRWPCLMIPAFEAHCQETTSARRYRWRLGLARSGQPPSLIGRFN